MRVRWKGWATAVIVVTAVDAAVLLAAGVVLPALRQLHDSAFSMVGLMLADLSSVVPSGVAAGMAAILSFLGVGWWQHLVGPSFSGEFGSGAPALAGALAVPVYTVVRRKLRAIPRPDLARPGAPPHRIYVAAGQVDEPSGQIPTAIQVTAPFTL